MQENGPMMQGALDHPRTGIRTGDKQEKEGIGKTKRKMKVTLDKRGAHTPTAKTKSTLIKDK